MRRPAVAVLLALGAGLLYWLLVPAEDATATANRGPESAELAALHERRSANLNALLNSPTPEARGELTIRGTVLGPEGPLAGAIVTATSGAGEDVLSGLPCACDNHCGMKLLECGCGEAAGQIMKLAAAREGEAPPIARAKTAGDGTFELKGLEAGEYALWADRSGVGVGLQRRVPAGAVDVSIEIHSGFDIEGTVKGDDGAPISGALVTAIYAEHSRFFDAIAGADGTFRIGPVPAGEYTVVATSANLLPDNDSTSDSTRKKLELTLSAPRAFAGRVVRSGQPVRGATVKLDGQHRKEELSTGDDGAFRFGGLRPGAYSVVATIGSEAARTNRQVHVGQDLEGVVLELLPAAGLEVAVVDEAGRPVAGARVSADNPETYAEARAETEADGLARVSPLDPGIWDLSVSAKGFIYSEKKAIDVQREGAPAVRITLTRASPVRGTVFDPDGNPIGGATVVAYLGKDDRRPEGEHGWGASGRSAEDGTFEVDGLRAGRFMLKATKEGFRDDEVSAAAPSEGVQLVLGRGGELAGRVLDERDAPVEGARVVVKSTDAASEEGQAPVGTATTDRAGAFAIRGLPDGRVEVLAVTGRGYEQGSIRRARGTATIVEGMRAELTLKFDAGLAIAGVVVDGTGAPVSEVKVVARQFVEGDDQTARRGASEAGFGNATSGADGGFSIGHLPPGDYQVYAFKDGYALDREGRKSSAGEKNLRLVLEKGGMLKGRVVREDGQPVTRYKLNRRPLEHPNGEFELPILESGEIEVYVEPPPGLASTARKVQVQRGVDLRMPDIVLRAGRQVTGQVVDALTSKPIPGALVDIGPVEYFGKPVGISEEAGAVRSGADGSFTLPDVDNVPLGLFAVSPGYAKFEGPLAAHETNVRIAMMPGATIRGTVVDGAGTPVARAIVAAAADASTGGVDFTREDGTFTLKGLPAGNYVVTVTADPRGRSAGVFEPKKVQVAAMEEIELDFRARAGKGALEVSYRRDGERTAILLVPGEVPVPKNGEEMTASFVGAQVGAANGRFENLPAGRYSVFLMQSAGGSEPRIRLHRELVTVTDDAVKSLEMGMPAGAPVIRLAAE